jgi:hypothetical protein
VVRLDGAVNGVLVLSAMDRRPVRINAGQPGLVFRTMNVQPIAVPSPVAAWWRGARLR